MFIKKIIIDLVFEFDSGNIYTKMLLMKQDMTVIFQIGILEFEI